MSEAPRLIRHTWLDGKQFISHADDVTCDRCSPPPTREPIRLTDEEREALLFGFGIRFHENADHTRFAQGVAAVESILTARFENDAATKADAWDEGYDARDRHDFRDYPGCGNPYRTPESEDTE